MKIRICKFFTIDSTVVTLGLYLYLIICYDVELAFNSYYEVSVIAIIKVPLTIFSTNLFQIVLINI